MIEKKEFSYTCKGFLIGATLSIGSVLFFGFLSSSFSYGSCTFIVSGSFLMCFLLSSYISLFSLIFTIPLGLIIGWITGRIKNKYN